MGRKLWLVWILAAGMVLALWLRTAESKKTRAVFVPGEAYSAPPAQELAATQTFALPYVLEDGGLVAEELVEYEGPYIEDGSHDPVKGVAALMLYNSGNRDISSGMVAVRQGPRTLYFYVTWLPAGQRALVLAFDRAVYSRDAVTGCYSRGVRWECFYPAGEAVRVTEDGALRVENYCAQAVTGVRLRYKTYIKEGDFYLGGITYSGYVGDLQSGESREVQLEHYAAGCAKVVAVLTR